MEHVSRLWHALKLPQTAIMHLANISSDIMHRQNVPLSKTLDPPLFRYM